MKLQKNLKGCISGQKKNYKNSRREFMIFELSNEERKYLGLNEVKETWIRKELTKNYIIYIEENKLVKRIQSEKDCYYESDVLYNLSENHKFILPKTKRGKSKKLTESSVRNLKNGVYLFWWNNKVILANGKCEQSYYESDIAGFNISTLDDFKDWIKKWIKTTPEEELKEITIFKNKELKRYKYQEGDYFRLKLDKNLYGYGRIIMDIDKRQKEEEDYWDIFMGKPIIIELFHIITEEKQVPITKLENIKTFPSQIILNNVILYGEYEIIGHKELPENIDYPIHYGRGIKPEDKDTIHFQYGNIHKRIPLKKEYLITNNNGKDYKNNSISYTIDNNINIMRECIKNNSNDFYWTQKKYTIKEDLRNPENSKDLHDILEQFNLLDLRK